MFGVSEYRTTVVHNDRKTSEVVMTFLLFALLVGALGSLPLLVMRCPRLAAAVFIGGALVSWLVFYLLPPSLANPLWGGIGIMVALLWFACGPLHFHIDKQKSAPPVLLLVPAVALLLFCGRGCVGCAAFNAPAYAALIGPIDERVWTDGTQPKDPKHVRLVPLNLAKWMADKQLGDAPGAIGSQFEVDKDHMTLQLIHDELWYVAPLDFRGYAVWSSASVAPGYVMVNGEDPNRTPKVVVGQRFRYMPGAFFGDELTRHLWQNGYAGYNLGDLTFEVDEDGAPWWVVTLTKPSIAWWGDKVSGIALVNPTTGETAFHPLGNVPSWVDRVMPGGLIQSYVDCRGDLTGGWWNSWWGKLNLTKGQTPTFVHGSDGQPYWATELSSTNEADKALLGLMYTNARTGVSTYYRANGALDAAVLNAVDGKVSYKKWHGDSAVIYNLYGTMGSIVPLLANESNVFQGVAIVNIAKSSEVAVGNDFPSALLEYQKLLGQKGSEPTPELSKATKTVEGTLSRFASEVSERGTTYFVVIDGTKVIFTGGAELSPKLPLARAGDSIQVTYIDSPEKVVPMQSFEDRSLPLGDEAAGGKK